MAQYARETTVSPEKSRQEIEAALKRYGADAFGYAEDSALGRYAVQFRLGGRLMRLAVRMPDRDSPAFRRKGTNQSGRAGSFSREAYDQANRQRWRALVLYVKAALEAIDNEVLTLDQAFLSAIVAPNGQTIGDVYGAQIQAAVDAGQMPPLLPGP